MTSSASAAASTRLNEHPQIEVSVVMPCLNEAETLEGCIRQALQAFTENAIAGEVVIADNGSTDGSIEIAKRMGARVVHVSARGYGNALTGGIREARGRYILMADADGSYDFGHLPRFVEELRRGRDLVMGNRFLGGIQPGAMPHLHRYLGNPVLSRMGRLFFRSDCGDFHCGMRAFSKEAFEKMDLRTSGMEFASEMIVKASLFGMSIGEVATTLAPDGRSRPPHLRTWRDGWRHMRFLLLYSPRWLFLIPGALLMLLGASTGLWLLPGPRTVAGVVLDVHTMVYAAMAVLIGFQAVAFAVFAKTFAISEGLLPADDRLERLYKVVTLEVGLILGAVMMLAGMAGSIFAVGVWQGQHFGPLNVAQTLRIVIPSALALTLGFEIVLASFFLSVLGMGRR